MVPDPMSWVRDDLRTATGYSVLEAPDGTIKLDAMENPFGLPDPVRQELAKAVSTISLNRYPDPRATDLRLEASRLIGVVPEKLFFGNGSDEILLNLFLATKGTIVTPEPTFSMYRIIAGTVQRSFKGFPLNPDYSFDPEILPSVLSREPPGILVLASPNNPTGVACPLKTVFRAAKIAREYGFVTLLDEAYYPFHGETALSEAGGEDVLVLRTFSKMGLAGLRLGFLVAPEPLVQLLDVLRLPYNMDSLTQRAAVLLMRDVYPLLEKQVEEICLLRDQLFSGMQSIPGVSPVPSRANFILFRVKGVPPPVLFRRLLEKGVLVRDVSGHHPLLEGTLRVTVGTGEENGSFLKALREGVGG
ncbi:MAG: aminotransferase class I/II-fold pyridoxal phosphate-dependent enzyme [Nitrospirae bacterium]|nr:aminotransferase class I/II-fold pyridoxal phosphate-dependent enzyme [Nitrospirota bacterium]